jgi:hypothetical protein
MREISISEFIKLLKKSPDGCFNPWYHRDKKNDLCSDAPDIRRSHLETYLNERLDTAKYLFIAEALGYQGGHFTGIAMTSERILLGYQREKYGIKPGHVFKGLKPNRTSKPSLNELGMSEPTATIMWGALIELGIDPFTVVLWNSVPWHPYKKEKGMLTNRTPLSHEMDAGLNHIHNILKLYPGIKVVAVGRKCEESLALLGVEHIAVRHPANGGATKFRRQLSELAKRGQHE